MKYLKEFNEFEDWDYEEYDDQLKFEVGDFIVIKNAKYWNNRWVEINNIDGVVKDIKRTIDMVDDDFLNKNRIKEDVWVFKLRGHWPLFKVVDDIRVVKK